jgi:hypothetical protein
VESGWGGIGPYCLAIGFGSTDFSLCAFPLARLEPKPHRLKSVLRDHTGRARCQFVKTQKKSNFGKRTGYLPPSVFFCRSEKVTLSSHTISPRFQSGFNSKTMCPPHDFV